MKVFVILISVFFSVALLLAGCASPANDPTLAPITTDAATQSITTESAPEETEDDDSVAVESLLGVDDLRMQTVSTQDHPYDFYAKLYTYRFYSETSGDLLVIENVLRQVPDDFDGDGVVELFVQVFDKKQYVLYDLVDGQIVMESYDLVPDMVLDYEMLLDSEGYYLYEERWTWFFKDPATYVAEVAKRPEAQLYYICPSGIIPAYTESSVIGNAITTLQEMLNGEVTAYEKTIVYEMLTTIELSYSQKISPGDVDYQILFEKWSHPYEGSTEERNCYEQMSDLLDADPVLFLKGMAAVDASVLKKELRQVAAWLAKENFLYDAAAFERVLNWMEQGANTDREKGIAQMFRDEFEELEAPSLYASKLLSGESLALWDALSYDPEQVIYNLSKAKDEERKYLGQALWGAEEPSSKLLNKCYAEVERLLAQNPTGTLKDVIYEILLQLEWYGGYEEYVDGKPFDYQRLFDKWTYSDGALATNCYSQMFAIFDATPEAFMTALVQWNLNAPEGRDMETIALNFAYQYRGNHDYKQVLNELLEISSASEGARIFIQQSEKVENE